MGAQQRIELTSLVRSEAGDEDENSQEHPLQHQEEDEEGKEYPEDSHVSKLAVFNAKP